MSIRKASQKYLNRFNGSFIYKECGKLLQECEGLTALCGVALDPGAGRRRADLIGAGHTHVVPGHGLEVADFILERRHVCGVCGSGASWLQKLSHLEQMKDNTFSICYRSDSHHPIKDFSSISSSLESVLLHYHVADVKMGVKSYIEGET